MPNINLSEKIIQRLCPTISAVTMALKITLKPHEKMIIDGAVVTNGANRCELYIENSVPILRQKDILSEKEGNSPARRIYLAIQLMYIDEGNLAHHHKTYWDLVQDFIQAAPSTMPLVEVISNYILKGQYYQALKSTKRLIEYEKEIINRAHEYDSGLPEGDQHLSVCR